jgi:transposase InsO family protein
VKRLAEIGAQASMSAKGNSYDNAKAESFFKTLCTVSCPPCLCSFAARG